jgi:isopentenyldiphosphate isomerase
MGLIENKVWLSELIKQRKALEQGPLPDQSHVDGLAALWLDRVRPEEKEQEPIVLVDHGGHPLSDACVAPRWVCHLLGLRHRAVHVLLLWQSPGLGPTCVFQIRSWLKKDFPGYVDISVGGHCTGSMPLLDTALVEMHEELGISQGDLIHPGLRYVDSYESLKVHGPTCFYDREWREVYVAHLQSLDAIQFNDHEVIGVVLCPVSGAAQWLKQEHMSVANGLEMSLPKCLAYLEGEQSD